MVVSAGFGSGSIGVLDVGEVLQGGRGDPPVQSLESLLYGGILQDLHLPSEESLQLHLTDNQGIK